MTVNTARRYTPAIVLTVSLFFLWGMANNLNDILIAHFRRAFTLTDFETSFIQQVFYVGYFLLALPAALITRRYGYKASIVTGLGLYAAGALLFYPAAYFAEYRYFLVALFVIASGLAFLETSANPLIAQFGEQKGAARRLTLAQAANPIGTISGVLFGKYFILSHLSGDEVIVSDAVVRAQLISVQNVYLTIGLLVLAFAAAAAVISFPRPTHNQDAITSQSAFVVTALKHKGLRFAVAAQFFYVGAQVGVWSFTIRYAQANLDRVTDRDAANYLLIALILFGVGRLAGAATLGFLRPANVLALFSSAAALLTAVCALVGGPTGIVALTSVSFFMSVQFPIIFSIGLEKSGDNRQIGASLLVMAIIGGAVITALFGLASDRAGINMAYLVPCSCFVLVALFAFWSMQDERRALVR